MLPVLTCLSKSLRNIKSKKNESKRKYRQISKVIVLYQRLVISLRSPLKKERRRLKRKRREMSKSPKRNRNSPRRKKTNSKKLKLRSKERSLKAIRLKYTSPRKRI